MPRIYDRRSGTYLGWLNEEECEQLRTLFEEPTRIDEPAPIDPDAVERLAKAGASERLIAVLQQILQGREDFDLDYEPDLK